MTPGFDPTQVDWNNPGVEYLMKNFERIMADHRDEIMLLTKSNNQMASEKEQMASEKEQMASEKEQMASEKEQMASRNKELEERCSHLEAKYDKLIEVYNKLLDGAGNGITPDNPPADSDAGSKTMPKRHPKDGRRSSYNVREFTGYPRPKPPARSEAGRPTRDHVVHETATADELACRKCDYVLSAPTAEYEKTTEDLVDHRWQETSWTIIRRYCKKCRKQQAAWTDGVLPNEHYGINIMAQAVTLRCMVDSFEKIRKIFHMFHGVLIPRSTLNHFCNKVADRMDPLYQEIKRDLNAAKRINGDTTGWFVNGKGWYVWVFVGEDENGEPITLFEIDKSAGKDVPMRILEQFKGIVGSDSAGCWNHVGTMHQKCLLHYFRDMYHTTGDNGSSEFSLLFMELYNILKDAIATVGHESDEAVEGLKYRIHRLLSKEYEDKDCRRYVKRLKREGDSLFTFIMHDVEYHNNVSERALRRFSAYRQILYGNRSVAGARRTKILMSVYATCEQRGVNFYQFVQDYLSGKAKMIPPRAAPIQTPVAV